MIKPYQGFQDPAEFFGSARQVRNEHLAGFVSGVGNGNVPDVWNEVGKWWNKVSGASAMAEFNAAEAQKDRDWQEHMSNTAYQRQIEDMHAAGINPAMVGGGSGASTPSGAAAAGEQGHGGFTNLLASLARSAIGAVMTKKMIAAGASDHDAYRKMMSQYYSAKNALAAEKNIIARVHESKNRGFSFQYSGWKN